MKLFPSQIESEEYFKLTAQISQLIVNTCANFTNRLDVCHLALYLLHAQAKIVSFNRFDRYIYACGAILIATKLTEQLRYPIDIIKCMRKLLRDRKGLQSEDGEEKLKAMLKKVFEAQLTIMINIGFDFDIELGLYWLRQWQRQVKDRHYLKKAQEALTSIYQTNVVLFYQPEQLAVAAMHIVVKNEDFSLQSCEWQPSFVEKLKREQSQSREIINKYSERRQFLYEK